MKNYQKSIITIIKEKDKYEKMKEMWEMPVKNKKIWIVLIQKKTTSLWIIYVTGDLNWLKVFFVFVYIKCI